MKFKPFPELTDILLRERWETSGGYWHKGGKALNDKQTGRNISKLKNHTQF